MKRLIRYFAGMLAQHTPRRSWFAIWRWPRWTWCAIVPLIFAIYLLSAGPLYLAAVHLYLNGLLPIEAFDVLNAYCRPAWWLAENSAWFQAVCEGEQEVCTSVINTLYLALIP